MVAPTVVTSTIQLMAVRPRNGSTTDTPSMNSIALPGVRTAHVNKGLTYAHMESHMKAYDNYTELMDRFETVKTLSKPLASPYHYVQHWFFLQFPDYADVEKSVHKAYGGLVELVSAPSLEGFNLKENDSLMN